jgi:hypothetical protein
MCHTELSRNIQVACTMLNASIGAFAEFVYCSACYAVVICRNLVNRDYEPSFTTNIAPWALINQCLLLTKYNGHDLRFRQNIILSRLTKSEKLCNNKLLTVFSCDRGVQVVMFSSFLVLIVVV